MVSRMWAGAVVVAAALLVGGGRCEDRWVWGASRFNNSKASSIPGYVEPSSSSTTEPPPVTTFRPPFRPLGRAAPRHLRDHPRASANPLFLGSFEPFSVVPVRKPRPSHDGTTKSRVTADAAFDGASGAALDAGDKYTTLDRLQSERGSLPPLPRPKKHQLGGLHPDEVFYADDDLLIIKGGGFNSDAFEEPPQPLDAGEEDPREGSASRVSSVVVAPLPSPEQEYNGNIPAIVPPPSRRIANHRPLSLFAGQGSDNTYLLVPYVRPRLRTAPVTNHLIGVKNNVRRSTVYPYAVFPPPYITHAPVQAVVRRPLKPQAGQLKKETFRPQHPNTLQLPHSLAGDTDVNYRFPRPPVNPDAEVFAPLRRRHHYPGRFRQQARPRL